VYPLSGQRLRAEQFPYRVERPHVTRRVRAGGLSDGGLVHEDDFVDELVALDRPVAAGLFRWLVLELSQTVVENVLYEGGFSGAAHPVTHTRRPSGIRTSTFLRLCSPAPEIDIEPVAGGPGAVPTTAPRSGSRIRAPPPARFPCARPPFPRRLERTSFKTERAPERYCAVSEREPAAEPFRIRPSRAP